MPPASENEQQQREGARGQPCWGLAKFPAASISPSRGGSFSEIIQGKKKRKRRMAFCCKKRPKLLRHSPEPGVLARCSLPALLISTNEASKDPRGGAGTTEPNPGWGQGQLLHHFRISRGENQATNPSHLQESNSLARSAGDGAGKTELGQRRWLQHVPIKPKKQLEGYGVCAIPWCCFSIKTRRSNWHFWAPGTGCSSQHGAAVLRASSHHPNLPPKNLWVC